MTAAAKWRELKCAWRAWRKAKRRQRAYGRFMRHSMDARLSAVKASLAWDEYNKETET